MSRNVLLDKNQILEYFIPFFKEKGFVADLTKSRFIKNRDEGFDAIIVSISPYQEDFLLEFHLAKRIDKVESFVVNYLDYPEVFNDDSMTLVSSFARLQGEKYERFSVSNLSDLNQVHKTLSRFMTKRGFRILEQWTSLLNMNQLINEDPYSMSYFYNHFSKAIRGTVICRFTADERYELLKEVYLSILKKNAYPDEKIESYKKLIGFLDIYNPN